LRQCRDLHTRRTSVDAEDCSSVDLRRQIEPLRRRADQFEVLRLLEPYFVGNWHAERIVGKLSVRRASSRRRMQNLAVLRAARRRVNIPTGGRRRQHGSRGRPSPAQRLPRPAYRV
jgi:hypothetical protein